ncbi:MAG: GAF domain-containing protein [Opitutae bacterium]|nr:GAF domain-containing protein [Opitutae bacterium]
MSQNDPASTAFDTLYRISSIAGQTEDSQEALELILEEIVKAFNAATASISLVNHDTQCLEIAASLGLPDYCLDLQLPLGKGVTGWVALHGKPLLVEDVSLDSRYFPVNKSIHSELAAPMEEAGRVIGVVSVDSEERCFFTEEDQNLLTLLAAEASRVVGRIWHVQQLRLKAEELQALVDAGEKLVSKMDTHLIVEEIAKAASRFSKCEMAAIYDLDDVEQVLNLRVAMDRDGSVNLEESLALGDSSVGTAVMGLRQIEVLNLPQTEEHHLVRYTQEAGLVSMLVTPLFFGEEIIGVLNVYTKEPHRFSNAEKNIFQTLAGMGAIAIQNARLYRRVFDTEAVLRQSEKMNTLGLLAAEIAHEIRNPLTVIKLLFDPLEEAFPEGDDRGEDVRVIRDRLNQLEDIVSRVLDFGRASQTAHAEIDFDHLVSDTHRLLRLKLEQGRIEWCYEPHTSGEVLHAHRGQIQQLLLNLSLNALEAMPAGGRIHLSTERLDRSGTPFFQVTFSDTGKGVPEEVQEQIFDSFLSRRTQGTGLGLSITKRILREHRGDIELLSSQPGKTVFCFWLPLESE